MEVVVIGAGIGGIFGALAFKHLGYEVFLLEAGDKIGGCAASFRRNGAIYNVGATTIPGLKTNYPLERFLTLLHLQDRVRGSYELLDIVCEVSFEDGQRVRIFADIERTWEEFSQAFPVEGHRNFFSFVERTTKTLLTTPFEFSLNGGTISPLKPLFKIQNLRFLPYLPLAKKKALSLLSAFYKKVPNELLEYFRAQTFIVGQVELEKANALALTLGIGYNFTGIAYSKIGLGGLLETLAKGLTVNFNRPVKKIERLGEGYLIHVGDEKIFSKKVVISFPFLENLSVFDSESQLCRYFSKFTSKLSPYSAFVVYGKIKKKALANFTAKHHLIIGNRNKLEGTSGYLYLSVLEQENGEFATFTVSTHTPIKLWINLDEEGVKKLKAELERKIVKVISERFEINESDLVEVFSATPYTFKHYVNRVSLGGFSTSVDTPFWSIPNNLTPFSGMYLACDHAFAGQGFMGIALGCLNLYYGLNRKVKD
jgi:phytoene dehydrogenase-like protein